MDTEIITTDYIKNLNLNTLHETLFVVFVIE